MHRSRRATHPSHDGCVVRHSGRWGFSVMEWKDHVMGSKSEVSLALASWCAMMGRMYKIGGMVSGEIPGRGGDYPCPSIKKHAGWNTIVAVWRHTMRATDGL